MCVKRRCRLSVCWCVCAGVCSVCFVLPLCSDGPRLAAQPCWVVSRARAGCRACSLGAGFLCCCHAPAPPCFFAAFCCCRGQAAWCACTALDRLHASTTDLLRCAQGVFCTRLHRLGRDSLHDRISMRDVTRVHASGSHASADHNLPAPPIAAASCDNQSKFTDALTHNSASLALYLSLPGTTCAANARALLPLARCAQCSSPATNATAQASGGSR